MLVRKHGAVPALVGLLSALAAACAGAAPVEPRAPVATQQPQPEPAPPEVSEQDQLVTELGQPDTRTQAIAELLSRFEKIGDDEREAFRSHYVAALSNAYVEGHASLDEATRSALLNLLAELRDESAAAAFAVVVSDFAKNKAASKELPIALAGSQFVRSADLSKALREAFTAFDPEQADLKPHKAAFASAVAYAATPDWGAALIAKLEPEMVRPTGIAPDKKISAAYRTQSYFQSLAARTLGALGDAKAAGPLIKVLLDPAKEPVAQDALNALIEIGQPGARQAEALLSGDEQLLAFAAERQKASGPAPRDYTPTTIVGAQVLGEQARADSAAALLSALKEAKLPADQAFIARELLELPPSDEIWQAVTEAYSRIPVTVNLPSGKAALEAIVETLADALQPSRVDWLLSDAKRVRGGGRRKYELTHVRLMSAVRLMHPSHIDLVGKAVQKAGGKAQVAAFEQARDLLQRCKEDPECYLKTALDADRAQKFSRVKAILMLGSLELSKPERLIDALVELKDANERTAAATAIMKLWPAGSLEAANRLEQALRDADADPAEDFALFRAVRRLRARAR